MVKEWGSRHTISGDCSQLCGSRCELILDFNGANWLGSPKLWIDLQVNIQPSPKGELKLQSRGFFEFVCLFVCCCFFL